MKAQNWPAITVPPKAVAEAAAALRRRPDLLAELHWHRAGVANQLANAATLAGYARELTERIDGQAEGGA